MGKTLGYGNINLGNVIIETIALVSVLKHNLLSVSQICDRGYHVDFFEEHCEVVSNSTSKVVLKGYRHGNIYEAGPSRSSDVNVMSIAKKKYAMVIVDEFTRSDNGTEFKNLIMEEFCKENGIKQEFSAPGTSQQNDVVERKNRTLIEAARTMLDEAKLPTYFWDEAVETAYFTQNATLINRHGKTPYEMLSKFNLKADEGIFVGYPLSTKAFRVYNLRTRVVMESINVSFDDKKIIGLEDFNDHDQLRFENEDLNSEPVSTDVIESVVTTPKENAPIQGERDENPTTSQDSQEASELITSSSSSDSSSSDEPNSDNSGSSDTSNPEGSKSNSEVSENITTWGVRTRTATSNECLYHSFLSQTKPKKVEEALQDADWVQAIPNKTESDAIIIRNKARLVAKGSQQEGIDYD
ncbi:hypothetical protein AgCh_039243 [Apium graveolens]